MKGRWRPANSEHAETEQVVGRDEGRRKKSDERHWGASARHSSRVTRGLLPEPGVSPHLLAAVVETSGAPRLGAHDWARTIGRGTIGRARLGAGTFGAGTMRCPKQTKQNWYHAKTLIMLNL
ncbi:hypothetical protein GPALN_003180 [Globodera pallida]|nr:hypothetical protein GPALN_003180 [Globodera pallida]